MKSIKFDLIVERKVSALQEKFNLLHVIGLFETGHLEQWLSLKLDAVHSIDKAQDEIAIAKDLCAIFDIEISEEDLIDDIKLLCLRQQHLKSNNSLFEHCVADIKTLFGHHSANRKVHHKINLLRYPQKMYMKSNKTLFEHDSVNRKRNCKPKITETRIKRFIVRDDGTVIDTKTKLMWCRYSVGQSWKHGEVLGQDKTMTWDRAKVCADAFNQQEMCGGFADWRLPTIDELESFVFPGLPSEIPFWSSTPYLENNYVWYGYATNDRIMSLYTKVDNPISVRLTRTAFDIEISEEYLLDDIDDIDDIEEDFIDETVSLSHQEMKNKYLESKVSLLEHHAIDDKPKIPKSRIGKFIAYEDGTALDTITRLMWHRYAVGQHWQNGEVDGKAKGMAWDEAMEYADAFNQLDECGRFTDWRLPTIDELKSIVEENRGVKINQTVFPNTPARKFWSSSPYVGISDAVWYVDFNDSHVYFADWNYDFAVRLVRTCNFNYSTF